MAREIIIDVGADGSIETEYNHFPGDSCFVAADQLAATLVPLGVEIETTHVTRKRPEVELRKLPTELKAGR